MLDGGYKKGLKAIICAKLTKVSELFFFGSHIKKATEISSIPK